MDTQNSHENLLIPSAGDTNILKACIVFVYDQLSSDVFRSCNTTCTCHAVVFDSSNRMRSKELVKSSDGDYSAQTTECIETLHELSNGLMNCCSTSPHNSKTVTFGSQPTVQRCLGDAELAFQNENGPELHRIVLSHDGELCVLKMNSHLAGCVTEELNYSPSFVDGFLKYTHFKTRSKCRLATNVLRPLHFYVNPASDASHCSIADSPMVVESALKQIVIVRMSFPERLCLNYKWCYRVSDLVVKRMELDDAMNWLSTLGGGYSALGDYFVHHAVNAAQMSLRQLRIALEMGNPPTVIRCHLYYALSLLQTGRLRFAKHIIRQKFVETKHLPVIDVQLLAICRSLWNRLNYLRQRQRHQRRLI